MANHTIDSEQREVENNVTVCKRLLAKGGYLLIVGGEMSNLRLQDNPQLIVWDDNRQGTLQKTIPSNTRGIVYSRWVSHAMAGRLRNAAKKLQIPLFPMAKTREVRQLVMELLHEDVVPTTPGAPVEIPEEVVSAPQPPPVVEQFVPSDTDTIGENMALRKLKKGEGDALLDKHYEEMIKEDESKAEFSERYSKFLKKEYGIEQTPIAVAQAIYIWQKKKGKALSRKSPTPRTKAAVKAGSIDFDALEKMLTDAQAGITLALEAIPQLKAEVEQVREKQARLRALLD